MHNHHYQLFKVAILSVFLGFAVELKAQQIIIQKGDTLYSGPSDSIYVVSFKLKGINMDSIQKVNIKFFSGTAQQGIDFSLRDGNKPTKEIIGISITDGKGQFSIKVVNDIQEIKTINLQATITDGSRVQPDIARIIIMPLKKAKPEGSDPSKKLTGDSTVDSLYFKRYRQDGIPVYIDTDKKVKFPKRGHLKWLRKSIPKAINIRDVEIDRVAQDLFYIKNYLYRIRGICRYAKTGS